MKPPGAILVVERAYALSAFAAFGKVVGSLGVLPGKFPALPGDQKVALKKRVAQIAGKILGAVETNGFLRSLSVAEMKVFVTPFDELTDQTVLGATWRIESLQVLLWALRLIDPLPNYDALISTETASVLKIDKFDETRTSATLRAPAEIEAGRSLAELWHWRCRTREIVARGDKFPEELAASSEFKSYDDVVRRTAGQLQGDPAYQSIEIVEEDFAVRGKAVRDLSPPEFAEVFGIAAERHFAFNWLCGRAPANDWDKTPTDT